MTKHQPQERTTNLQFEVEKRKYQAPTLEQHHYSKIVAGVSLPIGTLSFPTAPDLFEPLELQ
jgi:hypothetical protein